MSVVQALFRFALGCRSTFTFLSDSQARSRATSLSDSITSMRAARLSIVAQIDRRSPASSGRMSFTAFFKVDAFLFFTASTALRWT